jgi:hypothetical protein
MDTHAIRFVFVLALFLFAAGQMAAQTPAAITDQMIKLTASTHEIEDGLAAMLEKPSYDHQKATAQVALAQQNVRKIRTLLDDLDNQYEKLSETQRSAVREAWDVVMILSTYVDGQMKPASKEDVVIAGDTEKSMLEEERTTAVCASRRTAMLAEVLERLK